MAEAPPRRDEGVPILAVGAVVGGSSLVTVGRIIDVVEDDQDAAGDAVALRQATAADR